MFYIAVALIGTFLGAPFQGYLETNQPFKTYQECIMALDSTEVNRDLSLMIDSMESKGFSSLEVKTKECKEEV